MRPRSRPNRGSYSDLCWERNEKETSEQNKRAFKKNVRNQLVENGKKNKEMTLTQLVKVGFSAVFLQNRAHHSGLEEGGPFVHQAPLPSDVVLQARAAQSNATNHNRTGSFRQGQKALTGHTLATMVWMFLVFPLLSVSLSRKKKYSLASLGSLPSGIRWASMKMGSE